MTTLNEAREAVYGRFVTQWGSTTEFALGNEKFDTPPDEWVRVTVLNALSVQDTLGRKGNRSFRRGASLLVQVYVRADTGLQRSDALAKQAADIFEGVSFSGLDFRAVVTRETGASGRWHQTVVEAEFDYYEIK